MLGAVGQQHHQAVDADAAAAGGRHAVLQRADEVGVVVHRLLVAGVLVGHLGLEAGGLVFGVVQLREAVGVLAAGDEQLEALGDRRVAVEARASGLTSTG
jgi:predicted membrane-bound spermidine synthase